MESEDVTEEGRIEAKSDEAAPRPVEKRAEPAEAPAKGAEAPAKGTRLSNVGQIDDLLAAVRRLETFAADEAKRVSGKLVPTVEESAKKNIWVSLLLALGLGLLLGIWLTGGRRRE